MLKNNKAVVRNVIALSLVYLLISTDELVKLPVYYLRYKQGKWIRNITKERAA